jgi:hypothetical protein
MILQPTIDQILNDKMFNLKKIDLLPADCQLIECMLNEDYLTNKNSTQWFLFQNANKSTFYLQSVIRFKNGVEKVSSYQVNLTDLKLKQLIKSDNQSLINQLKY